MSTYNPNDWVIKSDDTKEEQYQRLLKGLSTLLRVEETFERIAKEVNDERHSKNIEHH